MKSENGWGATFWGTAIAAAIAALGTIVVAYIQFHKPADSTSTTDFSVQGFVLDFNTHAAVSGASLEILPEGSNAPFYTSTDSTGAYHFKLQATTPTVVVTQSINARGYQQVALPCTIASGDQASIFLTPVASSPVTAAAPVAAHPSGSAVLNGPDQFPGTWLNENRVAGNIPRVEISNRLGQIYVHMWGSCQPIPCDWGSVRGNLAPGSSAIMSVQWTSKFDLVTQRVSILPDGRLSVLGHTHFTDNSHRQDYDISDFFVKQ